MRQLQCDITIAAAAAQVWAVLTDFAAYPEWNPFLERVDGTPTTGAKLTIRFHAPGARATTLRPTLVHVEPEHELRWHGHLLIPGLFDAVHSLRIEPAGPGQVLFLQHETVSGLLVPLLGGTLRQAEAGFAAMNLALKQRVERLATAP